MTDNHELPTIKEELTRKTFDELESLVNRKELGKITECEYKASINTLFAICSGLVDDGFFELITQASEEIVIDHSFSRKRVFKKGDKLSVISIAACDTGLMLALSATVFDEKAISGEEEEIREKVLKFSNKLLSIGFEELN